MWAIAQTRARRSVDPAREYPGGSGWSFRFRNRGAAEVPKYATIGRGVGAPAGPHSRRGAGRGFRPFVARRLGLAGYVLNSSAGVVAEVEGTPAELDRFVESLRCEAPPLARIEEMLVAEIDPLGERDFAIRGSQALPITSSQLWPVFGHIA